MGEWDAEGGTVPAPTMDCPSIQPADSGGGGGGGSLKKKKEDLIMEWN